ncbi:MAG: cohesin domain-containing protein [Anaerobutyricum hallii]|uniref:cohesin domain-containing protein n=1 Tax=Anaerobutyricum hallii TaxID=39488 RepID=UPI003995F2D6
MKSEKNNLRMGILKKCLSSLVAFIFVFTGCFMINVPVYAAELGPVCVQGKRDFQWPVPGVNNITSCYYNRDYSVHNNQGGHFALDIGAAEGSTVVAAYGGKIIESRLHSTWGNTILIEHANYNGTGVKLYTRYSHLNSRSVNVGNTVSRGTKIGTVGHTGAADGSHLDFCVMKDTYVNPWRSYAIDPFANQLLEMPNGFYSAGSGCCGRYVNEVKALYSQTPNTDSFISYLESPASGGNYGGGTIQISGYALHKNGLRNVTAWVNGHSMNCPMYNSPSVAKVYPGYPTGKEGFIATIPTSYLNEGENEIGIYAYENDDTPHLIAVRKFNYNSFISELETPKKNVSYNGTLEIKGYALHKNGLRNVTAWVNGQMMGVPMYERTEIADKYPGYPTGNEGFKTEIPLGCLKNGENEISIYAYESNDAAHNIATYKFDYVKDKIVISNVKVSDLTSSGYTVTCDVDAKAGISSVQFPTWSHVNGQDDLVWHQGTISGNKVSCRINVSEHKGDVNCVYQTDIYAYDKANHCETYRNQLLQYIDAVPPVISDVQITNVSENGYTISCVVNDKDSKIDRVQFPTWYGDNNPFQSDSSWRSSAKYSGKLENGRYVYRVNTSDYKNQIGKYTTHIYAWDERGNQSEGYAAEALIKKAHKHEYTSKVKKAATCTEDGIMLYTCKDNDDSYEKVIPATGHQNTELRNVKSATCASEGYTGDTYCKDCNTKLSTGKTIAKKNHNWDAGKITTKATCTKKGIKTYTCSVCKGTKTEDIAAIGHLHKETRNKKEATETTEGYTGDIYCKDCNTLLEKGKTIPKLEETVDKDAPIIQTESVQGYAGDEVTIPVTIKQNSGIAGFSYDVNYDSSKLQLKKMTAGTVTKEGTFTTNGNVVNWYTTDNITANGTILNITFTILKDTADGKYPVSISLHDGKKNLVNEEGSYVKAAYKAGEVEVVSGILGDINGDKDITIADVVLLNRYVLGKASLDSDKKKLADINSDGDVTIGDVVLLNRQVLGKDTPATVKLAPKKSRKKAAARASEEMKISVDNVSTKAGETISIPVRISNNQGIAGIAFSVELPEGYSLVSMKKGEVTSEGTFTVSENNCTWYTTDNIKTDGILLTLEVKAGENAKTGKIKVNVKDGKANNISDENGMTVPAVFTEGTVTIAEDSCAVNGHKGGKATCIKKAVCTVCGKEYGEVDLKNHEGETEERNYNWEDCTKGVCLGDTYCKACGTLLIKGTHYAPRKSHYWMEGVVIKAPTATKTGIMEYGCLYCNAMKRVVLGVLKLKTGEKITDKSTGAVYKVTGKNTVEYVKATTKKASRTIPSTVKLKGIKCQVTSIAAKAFKGDTKIKTVVIPSTVRKIGKEAFAKCKNLKKITIKTAYLSSKKVGANAFKGIHVKATIKVPKKQKKAYQKLLKAREIGKKVTVK